MVNGRDVVLRNSTLLCLDFAVRICVENLDGDIVAIHLQKKEKYQLNRIAAYILIFFSGGDTVENALKRISKEFDLLSEEFFSALDALLASDLLVFTEDHRCKATFKKSKQWISNGWIESLDYNLLTTDYPFLDYRSTDSWAEDVERMEKYRVHDKEPSRHKNELINAKKIECESTIVSLKSLNSSINEIFSPNSVNEALDVSRLKSIISCSLGKLRERPVPGHPEIPPFLRKTSPSGGSRHPTEGYIINLSLEAIDNGLYWFSPQSYSLQLVNRKFDIREIRTNLEGLFRAEFEPRVLVVLTSVFKRNMFRYREPRTFRTIFIDAGHVASTIEMVSRALKVKSFVQHGINDKWFEGYANISGLEEGAILGIALG